MAEVTGGKTAFLFPGQGAQSVGMGRELYNCSDIPELREVFLEADDVLGFSLSAMMFNGPEEMLTRTENAQPALVTTAIAAFRMVLLKSGQITAGQITNFVAGHSLGEYAAICAAGGLSFRETIRLVRLRGEVMQQAVPEGEGGMAAMLNITPEKVADICRKTARETDLVCAPANYNTPLQTVISGHKKAVKRAVDLAKKEGAKRSVLLTVSAPFHCELMEPAAVRMREALEQVDIKPLSVPLIANVTAEPVIDGAAVRELLVRQVTAPVLWEASIRRLIALGTDRFLELGTGRVLTGMMKRIDRALYAGTLNAPDHLKALLPA